MKKFYIAVSILFSVLLRSEYKRMDCVIHLHSNYSESGRLSIKELVDLARYYGIEVVIPTDHFTGKIEYGIFPFRGLIKKVVEKKSVSKIGIRNYMSEVNRVQQDNEDVLIIPGVEVAPFYYWIGDIFRGLCLMNWHKHMLVINLNEKSYYGLPVVGNAQKINLILLYPVVLLFLSIFVFMKRRILGGIFCVISILLFINNFPFSKSLYEPYSDYGEKPYQDLINYVNLNGGLVYWAHPEAVNFEKPIKIENISVCTPAYYNSLVKTFNYTGFAYFWEGDEIVGKTGGLWDKILIEYLNGRREKPVFAIGELDYICEGYNNTWMNCVVNVLLVKDFKKEEVVECLRCGRYYILMREKPNIPELVLERFEILCGNKKAVIGETLMGNVSPFINLVVESSGDTRDVVVDVIRNGEIFKSVNGKTPLKISITDEGVSFLKRVYYRVEVKSEKTKLVTNPIFFIYKS